MALWRILNWVNLNFASFRFDAKQIFVNPISLLASQQIDIVSVGNASIDGTINKADLGTFLSNEQVVIFKTYKLTLVKIISA